LKSIGTVLRWWQVYYGVPLDGDDTLRLLLCASSTELYHQMNVTVLVNSIETPEE
jgi:hypothetical protein